MDSFLGYPVSWWIAVRAVLRKADLDDPDKLAARLGTTAPPCWTEEQDASRKRQLETENT